MPIIRNFLLTVVLLVRHGSFPNLPLFTVDKNFGGWARAQHIHFDDGGTFDQVFAAARR